MVPLYSCVQLRQLLTVFFQFFAVRLGRKFVAQLSLKILPHMRCVVHFLVNEIFGTWLTNCGQLPCLLCHCLHSFIFMSCHFLWQCFCCFVDMCVRACVCVCACVSKNLDICKAPLNAIAFSKALRYGNTQFYLQTCHTRLYSPAAEHHFTVPQRVEG